MRISIVIPTKNESGDIGDVIDTARGYGDEVMVVDGGSKDNTREIAASKGARVLLDSGEGKGAAIRLGIKEAAHDIIVFMDADGSHDAADIPRLTAPIEKGEADMVIGSRMRGGSDELHGNAKELIRLWGSGVITLAINTRFGKEITDYQNGFRAIRTDIARRLTLKEKHTTIEQEMSIACLKNGFRIAEVPTHEYRRRHGESKVNALKQGPRYVYSLAKNLFFLS